MSRLKELLEKLKWAHVALAIGLAGVFFYYTLDQSEIEIREQGIVQGRSEITNLERKIQEAKDFERQFEEKKKRYSELVKELQKIQGALPKQFFLPDLLSDLLREAKQLEVEIISIRPDPAETTSDLYNSLGFNIEARGTFLQFFILLDRMAAMKRLVNVQNFSLERDSARKTLTLGGEEGAFAGSKLTGGRTVYPGVRGTLRVITYRYRGAVSGAPDAVPGGK
jgi:Tfp pilus assembly protein PilO